MKKSLFLALAPTTLSLTASLSRCEIQSIPKFHNPNGPGLVIEFVSPDGQPTSPANLLRVSPGTPSEPGKPQNRFYLNVFYKEAEIRDGNPVISIGQFFSPPETNIFTQT